MNNLIERLEETLQSHGISIHTFYNFVMLMVCLFAFALLMQYRMTLLLNNALEQQLTRQTANLSMMVEERFNKTFENLEYLAKHIEESPSVLPDLVRRLNAARNEFKVKGVTIGIIDLNGKAIQGTPLSNSDFKELYMAFRGNRVVDYCEGKGLLFAYPIFNGNNVRYVIYRLYEERVLFDNFGLEEYDSASRILIQNSKREVVVPYRGYNKSDETFFADPVIYEDFFKIRDKLKYSKAAAIYSDSSQGKFFLFGADLPQTDLTMIGYVPWSAVGKSVEKTNMLILIVNTLLSFLFLVVSIYLMLLSERAKLTDKLSTEKTAADQANQAKSAFLANMSHEIRTPINAVIGMNEMILRECKDPTIIKYAQNAHAASEALLSLINDILDFSKIESGKMELVEDTYKLDELIKNLVNMIKPRVEKKNLEFKVTVNENIPNELFGDNVRIRQVIVNFLSNAVKYTRTGSIELIVEFTEYIPPNLDIEISEDDNFILLMFSVKDTGIGIRDEDRVKLFKDFERLDNKKNKNIEGTGLGLAITYNLVKMMHGNILVESVYGAGSTFTVVFPQKVIGNAVIGNFEDKIRQNKVSQEVYKPSFIAPDAKVLVVDDNEMNLFVATSLLKGTKIQVDTAMSGMSALKKMAKKQYDMIFLDQMMPSLDGIQTLKLANEMQENKSKGAPVVALTANAISGAREMFLNEGFTDYLSKPIDSIALEKMLMEYLPDDKLQNLPKVVTEPTEPIKQNEEAKSEMEDSTSDQSDYNYLNPKMGIQYSAGMEDMYRDILAMFCNLKDEKKIKIQEAFDKEDWNNYTTFVHALKSTAKTVGGEQTSEIAKKHEMAGKILIAATSSELDKHEAEEYIRSHNGELMELYDKLVEEGRQYLDSKSQSTSESETTSTSTSESQEESMTELETEQPEEIGDQSAAGEEEENEQETISEDTFSEDLGLDFMLALHGAFEKEDWTAYSSLIHKVEGGSDENIINVLKQVKMACQMITSDLTTDAEKAEAVNYIKEHHADIIEVVADS